MLFDGLDEGKQLNKIDTGALVINMLVWDNSTLVISCSDKTIRFYSIEDGQLIRVMNDLHGGSAVRFICKLNDTHIITGGLDGRLLVSNFATGEVSAIFRAHTRYITSLDVWNGYVVSTGYDRMMHVFKMTDENGSLKNMASLAIDSIPTSAKIVLIDSNMKDAILSNVNGEGREENKSPPTSPPIINGRIPVVILCRQDSTHMFYYSLNSLKQITKVNLCDADYGSDSFTPMDIAVDDKRQRYAVATNHVPYLRVITGFVGQKSIVNNLIVFAPQDSYSIPQLRWSRGGKVSKQFRAQRGTTGPGRARPPEATNRPGTVGYRRRRRPKRSAGD